jgi:hypothetical protein
MSASGYEKGEIAAESLYNLEPDNVHNFVTLMKMYENTGRLEEVEKMMRNVMSS